MGMYFIFVVLLCWIELKFILELVSNFCKKCGFEVFILGHFDTNFLRKFTQLPKMLAINLNFVLYYCYQSIVHSDINYWLQDLFSIQKSSPISTRIDSLEVGILFSLLEWTSLIIIIWRRHPGFSHWAESKCWLTRLNILVQNLIL